MAKIIKLTEKYIDEIRKDFEKALSTTKFSDGKINFTKSLSDIKRDATVYFTELAWIKMQTLVREFDKEVAWHGIAKRGEDLDKDEYYITDILVYPQEVTGATVNTDQEKYQMWLMGQEDEVFNNIRMQGHSHVNMGVTPSGVDCSLYDRILDQLDDDMFYIFMIWNKRWEKTIKIYDLAKNVMFDTSDCKVKILDDGVGIEKFLKDAKENVKDKVYTAPTTYSYTPCQWKNTPPTPTKTDDKKDDKVDDKTSKRSGKRKGFRGGNAKHISSGAEKEPDEKYDWANPYSSLHSYYGGYYD